jgi:hypothetical protein
MSRVLSVKATRWVHCRALPRSRDGISFHVVRRVFLGTDGTVAVLTALVDLGPKEGSRRSVTLVKMLLESDECIADTVDVSKGFDSIVGRGVLRRRLKSLGATWRPTTPSQALLRGAQRDRALADLVDALPDDW